MTHFALVPWLEGLGWCALAVAGGVLLVALVARRVGRINVIDVGWGLGFVLVAVVSALLGSGHGSTGLHVLLPLLTALWGGRLAWYIGRRSAGQGEDPRYAELLDRAGSGSRTAYAIRHVYLPQAVALWFISLPLQLGAYLRGDLTALTWVGVAVWAVGLGFEAVGDRQLARFRADPATRGTVLATGLWRYTRHPNYFGDAVVWWGLFLITCTHLPGVATILSPAAMTFTLAKGTGKPLLEKRMATSRPGYAAYVATTSGFLPLPPRRRRPEPALPGESTP